MLLSSHFLKRFKLSRISTVLVDSISTMKTTSLYKCSRIKCRHKKWTLNVLSNNINWKMQFLIVRQWEWAQSTNIMVVYCRHCSVIGWKRKTSKSHILPVVVKMYAPNGYVVNVDILTDIPKQRVLTVSSKYFKRTEII